MSATVFYAAAAELATLTNLFDVSLVPTDPTAVSLVITDPLGGQTTYTYPAQIARLSAGDYTIDIPCLTDGLWSYVWIGTGTASDVVAGTWTVMPQTVGHWYTSAEELKSRLKITDTADDFEILLAVQAAASSVDKFTGRFFWNETGVRTYMPESIYELSIDDLVSVTQLATDQDGDGVYETVWSGDGVSPGGDFQLRIADRQYNVASRGESWPYTQVQALGGSGGKYFPYVWPWTHQDRVKITGTWGWPAVPVLVRQASLQLANDLFRLRDAPFGVAGFAEYGAVRVRDNPAIAGMLSRYVRGSLKVGV